MKLEFGARKSAIEKNSSDGMNMGLKTHGLKLYCGEKILKKMLRKSQSYHQSSFAKWKTAALLVLAAPRSSARSLHVGVKPCWVQMRALEHQSAV